MQQIGCYSRGTLVWSNLKRSPVTVISLLSFLCLPEGKTTCPRCLLPVWVSFLHRNQFSPKLLSCKPYKAGSPLSSFSLFSFHTSFDFTLCVFITLHQHLYIIKFCHLFLPCLKHYCSCTLRDERKVLKSQEDIYFKLFCYF